VISGDRTTEAAVTTATLEAPPLTYDDPGLLAAIAAALTGGRSVVVRLTGAPARRAATVFLGGDFRLYDGTRTLGVARSLTTVLRATRLGDLERVIAMGRARGRRVDVEYVDGLREFRVALVPPGQPPSSARSSGSSGAVISWSSPNPPKVSVSSSSPLVSSSG
jgi:hypothetical protein